MEGKKDLKALVHALEGHMREGQGHKVVQALRDISVRLVPRQSRLPLANLARRTNLTEIGLRLLSPIVGVSRNSSVEPTPAELAEYAMLLNKIGSTREALSRLAGLDIKSVPEAALYRAFCFLSQWNYESARIELQSYIAQPGLGTYQQSVAQLNLAAVEIFLQDLKSAEDRIRTQVILAEQNGYRRSLANAWHLHAQIAIHRQDHSAAIDHLERARHYINLDGTSESLFIEKWRVVALLLSERNPEPLREFKQLATKFAYWEGARDVDYHLAKFFDDRELLEFLYSGTPFEPYRQKLLNAFPFTPGSTYVLGERGPELDLELAKISGEQEPIFKPGQKTHQLLNLLLSDFYRPQPVGSIHSNLFPDEHFNIYSSPNRVYQLVIRARRTLADAGIGLSLTRVNGGYHFRIQGLKIRLKNRRGALTVDDVIRAKLNDAFAERPFTSGEARLRLAMSAAHFSRMVTRATHEGWLQKSGAGRKTKYRAA